MKLLLTFSFIIAVFTANAQVPAHFDPEFNPTDINPYEGLSESAHTITDYGDGRLVVAGYFSSYAKKNAKGVVRLQANGQPDTSFTPPFELSGYLVQGTDASKVEQVAVQSDGKTVVVGRFTSLNMVPCNYVARLNANGSIDTTFHTSIGANDVVTAVAIQADGKIIISGQFTSYNGVIVGGIARLNTNGSIDNTFNPSGLGIQWQNNNNSPPAKGWANKIVILSDGKILIGGYMSYYNGNLTGNMAKINSDGSYDATFIAPINRFTSPSTNNTQTNVFDIKVLPDNKIMVGGEFKVNNTSFGLVRLLPDGTQDNTFNFGLGVSGGSFTVKPGVHVILPLASGKIIIGGIFNTVSGTARNAIARVNTNGSVDASYGNGIGFKQYSSWLTSLNVASILALYLIPQTPDENIICTGGFSMYNDYFVSGLVRLDSNSAYVPSFPYQTGANSTVYAITTQPDNKVLLGGSFTRYNGAYANGVVRINTNGTIDTTFEVGAGMYKTLNANDLPVGAIKDIVLQPDGKIIIAGGFTKFKNISRSLVARLNSDGTLDTTFAHVPFNLTAGIFSYTMANTVVIQTDGKIVVGGCFAYTYNNPAPVTAIGIVRLNADGTHDTTFHCGVGLGTGMSSIRDLYIQPDGKIMAVGSFGSYNGTITDAAIRLNADGTLDSTFLVNNMPGSINVIKPLANGKYIIGGMFYPNTGYVDVCRINNNGSIDLSFPKHQIGDDSGIKGEVHDILVKADSFIVIGGRFNSYDMSIVKNNLLQLNPAGNVDTTFVPTIFFDNDVRRLCLADTGNSLFIGGSFALCYDDTARNCIAKFGQGKHPTTPEPTSISTIASNDNSTIYSYESSLYVNIQLPVNSYNLYVYTLQGQLISSFENVKRQDKVMKFTVPGISSGLYVVRVVTSAKTYAKKVYLE